jgi:oligopeptide transport system substrate-binding protein
MNLAFARLKTAALATALVLGTAVAAQAETVMHRGNGAEPETLDPHKSTGVTEANIIYDLLEGLLVFAADGTPAPGVAERWDISDDGKTYTFHLRENAKWSNGDPVTSEDFVYSIRRAVDPATAADYAPVLAPIMNAEAIIAGEMPVDQLGVTAVDAKTLKIDLKAPTPYFLGLLVHHISWPVHKATVEQFGDEWTRPGNSVTNGAYTITEWVPQSKVVLTKNPMFHDAANVKIDTVVMYPTEDIDEEFKRFQAGELDFTYTVPTTKIEWAAANMPNEYRNSPYFGTYYYVINLTKEPLGTNLDLRRALGMAIDRDLIVGKITKGGEAPAYAWVPPGVSGYDQQAVDFAGMTQAERDAEAKRLMSEAGHGPDNPLKVTILYNNSERHQKIAIAIASMWREKLGVDTTLTNQEWASYLDSRDKKNFEVARAAWIGDYMDASNFLDLFISSAGERNDAGYNNPKFDELMNAASVNPDPAARQNQLEEAESVFLADMPMLPIYHYRNVKMVSPKVEGVVENVMGFNLSRYMSIAN